jgi:hypothetical protein
MYIYNIEFNRNDDDVENYKCKSKGMNKNNTILKTNKWKRKKIV